MINSNILQGLKPHEKINESDFSPTYFVAIKDIEQTTECNEETIKFRLCQINESLSSIETEYNSIDKVLSISGILDIDDDGLISTRLIGYEVPKRTKLVEEGFGENSNYIEVIQTPLAKKIDIDFNYTYTGIPSVIINIDKQHESLYRTYSCEYKIKTNENETEYDGVVIYFNSLKTKNSYPDIKITIIGDAIPEIDEGD